MWPERLVQPGTLKSFLEDQLLVPAEHSNRLDQGLAVGLDRGVFELPALLGNHRQLAVRGICVHPDGPFRRRLLSSGIVDSATRGCPPRQGGTNSRALGDLRRCSQTPCPYAAYPHWWRTTAMPASMLSEARLALQYRPNFASAGRARATTRSHRGPDTEPRPGEVRAKERRWEGV